MTQYNIAIIGCGIAGLASGLQLARAGHSITLFERFEHPKSIGAGILLQPTGLIALKQLDLLEEISAQASRIDSLIGHNQHGRKIMNIHYADSWPGIYGLGVHRGNLFRTLYQHTLAAGVQIHCAANITTIQKNGSQQYYCYTEDGKKFAGYDGIIIASGAQTTLRTCLKTKQRSTPYPWGALWTICPDTQQRFRNKLSQKYTGSSIMIGVLPTGKHPETGLPCISFFWSMRAKDYPQWQQNNINDWKTTVLKHWPELDYLLEPLNSTDTLTLATYNHTNMHQWHDDGILCIGDAGHSMSPQLGQGANLALIDAIILNQSIHERPTLPDAFAHYSQNRRKHLNYYLLASRGLTPFFQSNSRTIALLRDLTFPLLNKLPYTYRQMLHTVAGTKTGLLFGKPIIDLADQSFHKNKP